MIMKGLPAWILFNAGKVSFQPDTGEGTADR
jgi:hypothetical protein